MSKVASGSPKGLYLSLSLYLSLLYDLYKRVVYSSLVEDL